MDLHIRRYRELLAWPSPARDPRLATVAARTVCAVAALTGLARSEVPALQLSDYRNGEIHVSRNIGGSTSVPPKPRRAKRPFPSRAYLQEILANYKARVPPIDGGGMFYGQKEERPIHMGSKRLLMTVCTRSE